MKLNKLKERLPGKILLYSKKSLLKNIIILIFSIVIIILIGYWLSAFIGSEKGTEDEEDVEKAINICIESFSDHYYLALLEDDVERCKKADDRYDCSDGYYIIKAVRNNDMELCKKTSSNEMASACRGVIQGNAAVCDAFESVTDITYCRAVVGKDASICDSIEDESEKSSCKEDTYLRRSLAAKNSEECLNHDDEGFTAFCTGLFENNKQIYLDKMRVLCSKPLPPPS
ncbi:hypothetical protein CMO93_03035 [Candidatus Woesearchaeota archaeon]|nr:hypothetical protein [Candidatus Woesearchaeota archaeon]|tara:strand:- start:3709 stop:4395 length:687 start_codon:yes stop_codon:yes gene_type:complete